MIEHSNYRVGVYANYRKQELENARRENIDIDWKYEKNGNVLYEKTLGYKIKHPIYVVLNKIHVYSFIKRILKRGEI